jgi:hypothetical protein
MRRLIQTIGTVAAVLAAAPAPAALFDRGGGMIYDDVLNITWLSDWNYAVTSGYAATNVGGSGSNEIKADGGMGWDAANNWANNLVYGGFNDWRLPSTLQPDPSCDDSLEAGAPYGVQSFGYNCTGSEMGHNYYRNDLALFSNISAYVYWSSTEYAPDPSFVWIFHMDDGGQYLEVKDFDGYPVKAVAVRAGDVGFVPEPQTTALVLLALGLAAVVRRKAN